MAPMTQSQDPTAINPLEAPGGPERDGSSRDTLEDFDRDTEGTVRAVLGQQVARFQRRGALGADDVVDRIADGARSVIDEHVKKLKALPGTEASTLETAALREIDEYRRERVIAGLVGKGYKVMDLRAYQAAGLYKPDEDRVYIDFRALSPDVQYKDLLFFKHVCNHEDWHQDRQAKVLNAPLLRAAGREFILQPNLLEGQATAKNNKGDTEIAPEYLTYMAQYEQAAAIVGEARLDDAIRTGDILSLQEAVTADEQAKKAA